MITTERLSCLLLRMRIKRSAALASSSARTSPTVRSFWVGAGGCIATVATDLAQRKPPARRLWQTHAP
ncbi:hypothetical protein [Sorangium sp. So ce362]|uniref:hypothetical protein n=1 Tax=Sorangium sp. So ce362 TaxID=3133303 RepID=UPI003F63E6E7